MVMLSYFCDYSMQLSNKLERSLW